MSKITTKDLKLIKRLNKVKFNQKILANEKF